MVLESTHKYTYRSRFPGLRQNVDHKRLPGRKVLLAQGFGGRRAALFRCSGRVRLLASGPAAKQNTRTKVRSAVERSARLVGRLKEAPQKRARKAHLQQRGTESELPSCRSDILTMPPLLGSSKD
ncbi:hypothetical protein H920_04079 [Fukomys damarensis]|uniref:Uncharacterized protein n=1 Tax=Fukomys damarensis TaxID=885580 RepID=A0A091DW21_FUKDA|nr:hypothetical protein H920_04079 [Fukomys damarensis]